MASDPRITPLSYDEALLYFRSIQDIPLLPNTLFPPDELIAARSIKTTAQYAVVSPSKICQGRGLWLKPNLDLPIGTFFGIYIGWVLDQQSSAIWDNEDRDNSYALGLSGLHIVDRLGPQQAVVHAHDRCYHQTNVIFPLACANEWIWTSITNTTDNKGNCLRFGAYGMVFSSRHVTATRTGSELMIGLGKEGTPFGGWTELKRGLMARLLKVLDIILSQAQQLELSVLLEWKSLLDNLSEVVESIEYGSFDLLREDRSAAAILLAAVEYEREISPHISLAYDGQLSLLNNIRQMVQHSEVRKRCTFRLANCPGQPKTSELGSVKFWTSQIQEDTNKALSLTEPRRSMRLSSKRYEFDENNFETITGEDGHRIRKCILPLALIPDAVITTTTQLHSGTLRIYSDRECVIDEGNDNNSTICKVRFADSSSKLVEVQDLLPPTPWDFSDAKWTLRKTEKKIKVRTRSPQVYAHTEVQSLYGPDYSILDDSETLDWTTSIQDLSSFADTYGTPLQTPHLSTLRVCTWNASGLKTLRKLKIILAMMQAANIDILCAQDTRIEPGLWATEIIKTAKSILGPGSSVFVAHVQPRLVGSQGPNVGGQIIFKTARVGVANNFWQDESLLGLVCSLDIKLGSADIRLVAVYTPPLKNSISKYQDNDHHISHHVAIEEELDQDVIYRGNLVTRIQQYTAKYHKSQSATDYILSTAHGQLSQHLNKTGCSTICLGDFNANGTIMDQQSINGQITSWARQINHVNTTLVLSESGLCPPTFFRQGVGVSDIDHILLSRHSELLPIGFRVLDDTLWQLSSNHCPLVVDFEVPGFNQSYQHRRKRRPIKRPHLDIPRPLQSLSDEHQTRDLNSFRRYMKRLNQRSSNEPQNRLLEIMKVTRGALLSLQRQRRRTDLWDPTTVALMANQIAITEMGRYLEGSKKRKQWTTSAHITKGMEIVIANWERQVLKLSNSGPPDTRKPTDHWVNISGVGPTFWRKPDWERDDLIVSVIKEKRRLSRILHRHDIKLHFERNSYQKSLRARSRQKGTHLRELRALLESGNSTFSLDCIVHEDKLLLDPRRIHSEVSDHFYRWFQSNDTPWGFHDKTNSFSRLWTDREYFLGAHRHSNIPSHLLEIIWKAMQSPAPPSQSTQDTFELLLRTAPTLEEFCKAIDEAPLHSAGGPLDVTYNAMAAWDMSVTTEVHSLLRDLWLNKEVPMFWKWRWLVPIPKVSENVTLDDLRPLMLTDVSRKIWVGIVINKIQSHWLSNGLLSDSQHGFLEHRNTEGALLQFRNVLEEARESCTDVFLSSWDIRRAFDRVSKQLLTLGWMRLGVPQDIANYLVSIDEEGITMVRTPLAQTHWDKHHTKGFLDITQGTSSSQLESFSAETGTGQGNIDSPLNWISVMDILLRALETVDAQPFYVRTNTADGEGLTPVCDIAYADDLISLTSRIEGLQEKADIVCAFCLVFGLEIADAKLRAYKVHWGNENTSTAEDFLRDGPTGHFIEIHKFGWTKRKVEVLPYTSAKPFRYLGVWFDLNNSDMSSFRWVMDTIDEVSHKLDSTSISPDLKIDALAYVLYPKLLYAAQFASWSLKQYTDIDNHFAGLIRRFLGLRKQFPTELLFSPDNVCGLGFPRFSDEAHSRKIAILTRGFQSDDMTRNAARNLLLRGLRLQNSKPLFHQYAELSSSIPIRQPIFIRSIVAWLHQGGLILAKGGQKFEGTSLENIVQYLATNSVSLTPSQVATMAAYGLSNVGDIVSYEEQDIEPLFGPGRASTRKALEKQARELLGNSFTKSFPDHGSFVGTITSYVHPWFRIEYDDGDAEDLSFQEVLEHMELNEPPQALDTTLRWIQFTSPSLIFLNDLLPVIPPQLDEIYLARDQCYMSENTYFPMQEGWVWEVLGRTTTTICIRTWSRRWMRKLPRTLRKGDRVHLDSLSHGAATDVWVPIEALFDAQRWKDGKIVRLILGPDTGSTDISRTVLHIFRQPVLHCKLPTAENPVFSSIFDELSTLPIDRYQCFTDGSFQLERCPILNALIPPTLALPFRTAGHSPSSSGGLVVRKYDIGVQEPSELIIKIVNGDAVRCCTAYSIELMLLTLGCIVRWMVSTLTSSSSTVEVLSDCKSAIDRATATSLADIRKNGAKSHGLLLRQIYSLRQDEDLWINHVRGHPERRLRKGDSWQHFKGSEAGIFLADRIAGSPTLDDTPSLRTCLSFEAADFLKMLGGAEECLIVREHGNRVSVPILEDPAQLIQHSRFTKYLTQRDAHRQEKRWSDYIPTGPRTAFPKSRRFQERIKTTKAVFNWYWRQEFNLREHETTSIEYCKLCNGDINRDHEAHCYLYCNDLTIQNLRLEGQEQLENTLLHDEIDVMYQQLCQRLYTMLTTEPDRHMLWKGMFLPHHIAKLNEAGVLSLLSPTQSNKLTHVIKTCLAITGQMVLNIRKAQWKGDSDLRKPRPSNALLSTTQQRLITSRTQARLPRLWSTMSEQECLDWETARRFRHRTSRLKKYETPLPTKRQTYLRDYISTSPFIDQHTLCLTPSQIVIKRLHYNNAHGTQ